MMMLSDPTEILLSDRTKVFQQPKDSLNSITLSRETAEQAATSGIASTRPVPPPEVIPIQHQDQAKTVPELRLFHPTVRLRMLEDD